MSACDKDGVPLVRFTKEDMDAAEAAAVRVSAEKPAFPQAAGTGNLEDWRHGMLLRDHFAGLAMQAYVSDPSWREDVAQLDTARSAYDMADAMLLAREEGWS